MYCKNFIGMKKVMTLQSHFSILNIETYNGKLPTTLSTELLYNTTKTVLGGAIYHDYPLTLTSI